MQKRFVSWAAVSSLPQAKKISVDDQLKTNLEHVERWDGILHKELPIRGQSRYISSWENACATIPEYAALRDMIERREFDVLIYLDRSRLGRKSILIDTLIDRCHEAGIVTYSTESPPSSLEPPEHNFANKVVGAIESIMAQEEVHKIQRRHEMGMAARVKSGNFPARIPFGWTVRYEVEDGKPIRIIEVDEQAKATIVRVINLYLDEGMGFRDITKLMQAEGVPPPRGGRWKITSVNRMLLLAWRYAGFVELNRRTRRNRPYIRAKSRWPALITEERAKQIVDERERRAHSRRSVASPHLFSQMVWCRKCHHRMQARFQRGELPTNPPTRYVKENFRCVTDGFSSHAKNQISGFYLTDAVEKAIIFIQDEENRKRILEGYVNQRPRIEESLAKAKQRLAKHEEAVQRADDAYVLGRMDYDRYARQLENLERERHKLDDEIEEFEAQLKEQQREEGRTERLISLAKDGLQMLRSPNIAAANVWFRQHIRILVDNENPKDRVDIEFI